MSLERIAFSLGQKSLSFDFTPRYAGRYVVLLHQFGFTRVNPDTGEVRTIVGVGYDNPAFPPSNINFHIVGDCNQSVDVCALSPTYVVLSNRCSTDHGRIGAVVFELETLRFVGYLPGSAGFYWQRGRDGFMASIRAYVPDGAGNFWAFDVDDLSRPPQLLSVTAPTAPQPSTLDGYTYVLEHAPGVPAGNDSDFVLRRSDVAGEPVEPPPPPTPQPPAPPPATEEPPVSTNPTPSPTGECPAGYYFNVLTGHCEEDRRTPAPPPAPTPENVLHGQYSVRADFDTGNGMKGRAGITKLNDDTAILWFFSPNNPELFVAVVETERPGQPAVKLGGSTNVGFTVVITDTTGKHGPWTYTNAPGQMFGVLDWGAFAA